MHYLNKFKKLDATKRYDYFIELCKDPLSVQKNVLKDILKINENCQFGQEFHFSSIDTIKEYQKNIPNLSWKEYEKYILKMQNGEENILFAGKTEYFINTSGTTGKNKLIPESIYGAKIKEEIGDLKNKRLLSLFPNLIDGKFIAMSNTNNVGFTNANIPISSASGITTANTDKNLLKLLAFPQVVKYIEDSVAADYALMRFSIEKDVRVIVGNNAGRIPIFIEVARKYAEEIIKDIELGEISNKFNISDVIRQELLPYLKPNPNRAKELKKILEKKLPFLPESYWKNFKLIKCWISGSVGHYTNMLEPYIKNYKDKVVFFDTGYGASEAKFNIPIEPNTPFSPIALFASFYEFLPMDSTNENNFLLLHELEDQKEYQIFITTYSGLYRYNMKDIIKVNGFTHKTPNIAFISKTSDFINIAGEKMYAVALQKGCFEVAKKLNIKLIHFCVIPNIENLEHKFYIELEDDKKNISTQILQKELFEYFCRTNVVYDVFSKQHLINPLTVNFMKKGWMEALYKREEEKGLTRSQIKLPLSYKTLPFKKYLVTSDVEL